MTIVHNLTELQYAEPGKGPWKLYIYTNGKHSGGKWFRVGPLRYPEEEITFAAALKLAQRAVKASHEVRVTDGGDKLVYRAQYGIAIYGEDFWERACPANG